MGRLVNWIIGTFVVFALVLMATSAAFAQPPFEKGDTGFVSGSFCNREGHRKVTEALLEDYKTNGSSFPLVWDEQTNEKNCNTISETLILTVDEVSYEGLTRLGEMWTIKYLVAGIIEIFSGWFEQGSQPEPVELKGTPI